MKLDELDALKRRLTNVGPLSRQVEIRIGRLVEPRVIYASNAIEDRDALTLEETTVFLERGITCAGRTLEDFQAILQHRQAYHTALDAAREGLPLDVELVRLIHRQATSGLSDKDYNPGAWKTRPNRAAARRGRSFLYAEPAEVPSLMQQLLKELVEREKRGHPLDSVAWFYYHFFLIHPFNEGNGRVMRILASFLLVRSGYVPLVIDPKERGAYLDALAACDATVPQGSVAPLNPKILIGTFGQFLATCVGQLLDDVLGIVEGSQPSDMAEMATQAEREQRSAVAHVAQVSPNVGWRNAAADEVRKLHHRLVGALAHAKVDGVLYAIAPAPGQVTNEHSASRVIRQGLPTAGCGVVGEASLSFLPSTTAPLKLPAPRAFHCAIAATRYGLHLISRWEDEPRPVVRHGPSLAIQWSQSMLERSLALRIDPARRAYDADIVDRNRPAAVKAALRDLPGGIGEIGRYMAAAGGEADDVKTAADAEILQLPSRGPKDRKTQQIARVTSSLGLTTSDQFRLPNLEDLGATPTQPIKLPKKPAAPRPVRVLERRRDDDTPRASVPAKAKAPEPPPPAPPPPAPPPPAPPPAAKEKEPPAPRPDSAKFDPPPGAVKPDEPPLPF